MAYHPYELNSDDDDDEFDEVLEIDAQLRPHVVRRRRNRSIGGRVPMPLGLVSKRLHYDNLRSQTLHALNNKEWQQIIA